MYYSVVFTEQTTYAVLPPYFRCAAPTLSIVSFPVAIILSRNHQDEKKLTIIERCDGFSFSLSIPI